MSAPLGSVLAVFAAAVSPYPWTDQAFLSPGLLTFSTFRSPTHTFGICLFLGALVVTVILLQQWETPHRWRLVSVLALLALSAGGAKSTLLPVLACACGLVAVVGLLRRQRFWRPAAAIFALFTAAFVAVALAVIGTNTDRVKIIPGAILERVPAADVAGVLAGLSGAKPMILVLSLLSWLLAGAGGLLLLRRGHSLEPGAWLLVGVVIAGVSAALLTSANGVSQGYFLYAAWPALPALSAWGLSAELGERAQRTGLFTAGLLGAVAVHVLTHPPAAERPGVPTTMVEAVTTLMPAWGWLAIMIAVAMGIALAAATAAGARDQKKLVAPLVLAALLGTSLTGRADVVIAAAIELPQSPTPQAEGLLFPPGLADAALWLRDASRPSDVVATNAHCYGAPESCDARHFIVSALTERRVLVEGWAYPDGGDRGRPWSRTNPFWDVERYAQNEIVFTRPSQQAVELLTSEYGVRWLFVDRTVYRESPDLGQFAVLVYDSDDFAVYQVG